MKTGKTTEFSERELREIVAPRNDSTSWSSAMADISAGARNWRLWLVLGYRDMAAQYTRSALGPFWQTIYAFAWIAALSFIFSNVFELDAELNAFIFYISSGLVVFNFVNAIITGASDVYIGNRIIIHTHPAPISIYPMRLVTAAFFQLCFQSLAILPFLIIFPINFHSIALLAIPAMILILMTSLFVVAFIGAFGARYGDFKFALLAVMRLMVFVTPIFWKLDQWSGAPLQIVTLNPITNFLTLVRDPLLGTVPDPFVLLKCLFWTSIAAVLAFLAFARTRSKVAMWV